MSSLAPPPPPPPTGLPASWPPTSWGPSPAGAVARRRHAVDPTVGRAIAGLVIVAVFGALLSFAGRGDDPWADEWDPAVAPLAGFVERARGHLFRHPVHVDLLDDETFRAFATSEHDDVVDAGEDTATPLLRAFGLVGGTIDVRETGADLERDAALAFYDWRTKRITVRGTVLDAPARVTLVHELVHALQDQHFDLGAREASLDPDQYDSFLAVVEGDAERIAQRYEIDELDDDDRRAVDDAGAPDRTDAIYGAYPDAMVSLLAAPYSLGTMSTELLARLGGTDEVDRAILDPPRGAGFLLAPFDRLRGEEPPALAAPSPVGAESWRDEGSLGALFWYLVLEARIGPVDALAAADVIEADAYVTVARDGVTCVRDDLVAVEGRRSVLLGALDRWRAEMPAGSVEVHDDGQVHVVACDPGAGASRTAPADRAHDALALPLARLSIALAISADGATAARVECASTMLAARTPLETLVSDDPDARPPDDVLAAVRAGCPAR